MRKANTLILLVAVAVLLSCAAWAERASADNGSPISYHNGPVMNGTSAVYVIWYGNWSAQTGPNSADAQNTIVNFLSEIGGSINFQINNTYPGVNGAPSGGLIFGRSVDAATTHGAELDPTALQAIVSDSINAGQLALDPNGIYLVVSSSDISSNATGFCSPGTPPHHGYFLWQGQQLKYAFVGNAARCPNVAAAQFFANGSQLPTPNGNLAADAMVSTIVHVLDDTVTDPLHTAWFDGFGLENADKCDGVFSRTHTLANGARANFTYPGQYSYLIQDNWINNLGGYCGQQNDAPPRADDQAVLVNQDTAKAITLTAVDDNGDPLSFAIVTPPQHGALSGSGANRTYTPAPSFRGNDSFTFKANDGTLDSTVATVSITVSANWANDGFDPSANGLVRTIAVQPDGKILLGGDFTTLSPNGGAAVTRNYIARLNPDGSVDMSFNPNANSSVQSIALQADGKIILGGDFSILAPNGGAAINRTCIARLNPDGTVDPAFDPRANSSVLAIAVQPDGAIVIGGDFASFAPGGGPPVARNHVARLSPSGGVDPQFDPKANQSVSSLALQPDGRILIGGRFTALAPNGGASVARNYLARLNVDGSLDGPFNPNPNNILGSIALQLDGRILIGGEFSALTPNGGALVSRSYLARLNDDGTVDTTFAAAGPNGFVRTIALQPDGRILIGGGFVTFGPGFTFHKYMARLNVDGSLDPSVDPASNDQVFTIAVQADGKILAGGPFAGPNAFKGQTRNRIARLERDGRLDQTLNINAAGGSVRATLVQADGKIVIGGNFTSIQGVGRNGLARLNTDGTLDTPFNPNINGSVLSLALQPDGKIIVGGGFSALAPNGGASVTRNNIARLNSDGTVDPAFNPNANEYVAAIAVQPDGK
ncbi:MAG TPA: Ig-like domain-containing protein, partial [Pyrinomonadaceae bacterium]|nr:Ig-like domain-containing protein [Pyrinomonadaceae bacterium]